MKKVQQFQISGMTIAGFKSYQEHTELVFGNPTVITGGNGRGKTSVADAIASGNIVDWTFNTEWPASVIMNDLVPVAEEFFTTDMTEADFLTALNDAFVTAAAE